MDAPQTDRFLHRVEEGMQLAYQARTQRHTHVDVLKDLKTGWSVHLMCQDKRGVESIKLLFLGESERHLPHFLVLESSRLALLPDDMIEPADNTLWSVGHPLLLTVRRNGRPFPDETRKYLSYPIESMTVCRPSLVHEAIDSKRTFTHEEWQTHKNCQDGVLSFGKNPVSLLLHRYSSKMDEYADFDENGYGVLGDGRKTKVYLDNDTLQLRMLRKGETNDG